MLGRRLAKAFFLSRSDGGGMVFALVDVQAEEDVDAAGVDHVQAPPVTLFVRSYHGIELPHPRYGELFRLR
ncbi:hypothetical protein GCM10010245_66860 [Streptomyces spectabilis]|nr:hypothetical protein GCM10010245_66860 [Streptomyces spectabilis]